MDECITPEYAQFVKDILKIEKRIAYERSLVTIEPIEDREMKRSIIIYFKDLDGEIEA